MTMTPIVSEVPLAAIVVEGRLRAVDPAWVEVLAASMQQTGLRQAVIVRPHPHLEGRFLLIAGAHRLAAARSLGWEAIAADNQLLDDLSARLVEIDENLARRELTTLDRAIFLAERKRIYEALNPNTSHGGDRRSKDREIKSKELATCSGFPRFSAATAKATGISERAVQLLCRIANELDADVISALRATSIAENQAALLALTKIPDADRKGIAKALQAGATTLAAARKAAGLADEDDHDPVAVASEKIVALFSRLDDRSKRALLDRLHKMMKRAA